MIIEFYGLPASGKTAIAQKVSEQKLIFIPKPNNKAEIILKNIAFFFRYPRFYVTTLFYILRDAGVFRWYVLWSFIYRSAKYQKARTAQNAVLDEGYWQNVLSLFTQEKSQPFLEKYSKLFPHVDLVCIVETSKEMQQKFITKRSRFTREGFPKEAVQNWESVARINHAHIKRIIQEQGNGIICKNEGSLEDVAKICGKEIEKRQK